MVDIVNSVTRAGSFLTGKPNWISIITLNPVEQTNVNTPIRDLPGWNAFATLGVWTDVTVRDGNNESVTYTSSSQYRKAYFRQQNLNWLIRLVGSRVNVTQVSVKTMPNTINGVTINPHTCAYFNEAGYVNMSNAHVMGSDYNDTGYTVYVVDIAVEHSHAWSLTGFANYGTGVPANTNEDGYSLINALDGNTSYPENQNDVNSSNSDSNDPFYYTMAYDIDNTNGPQHGYWDVNTSSGCNTLIAMSDVLPGTLVA